MSNQLAAGLVSGPSWTEAEPWTTKSIAAEKAIEEVTPATGRLIVIDRRKCSRWRLCHEGKGRWIPNGIKTQVDVQKRPMEVVGGRSLHAHDLVDRCMAEPGEMLERQEELLVAGEHPEAVLGNVTDLNRESACATDRRFPPGDPRRVASPSLVARRARFYLKRASGASPSRYPPVTPSIGPGGRPGDTPSPPEAVGASARSRSRLSLRSSPTASPASATWQSPTRLAIRRSSNMLPASSRSITAVTTP